MNIVLAVVVLAIVLAQGAEVPAYQDQPPVVGAVDAGLAGRAGRHSAGDRILTVAGDEVDTWEDLRHRHRHRARTATSPITLLRDGPTRVGDRRPDGRGPLRDRRHRRAARRQPRRRSRSSPGEPAEQAGLKAGDVVLAVNGERMVTRAQLIEAISRNAGQADRADDPARRPGAATSSVTPEQRGRPRHDRHQHLRADRSRSRPARSRRCS